MKKIINFVGILASICCLVFNAKAQYPNIMISTVDEPNETSIFINPKNTQQILAGANINSVFVSDNGGLTWNYNSISSPYGVMGDPCMVIDTNGYFYFFHLSYPNPSGWLDRIVCQRSLNQGLTWSSGSGIGKNSPKHQDKEWAVVNPYNNELYVTWTQFDQYGSANPNHKTNILFSKSTDQGLTWSTALQINEVSGNCIDSDLTVEGAVPAVGPSGEIYTSWAGPAGLVFDRSLDGGITWLEHDIFVSDIPGGWDYSIPGIYRANGLPVTCCDISNSPYRGNIYINWTDERNNSGSAQDVDVWFVKSTDGGNTWSTLRRVNNDAPGKQQFFTWMTVDQLTGYIWFVFYDRRNYNDTHTDVYLAVSKDGGETFENFKVSNSPFVPDAGVFFGDYTGISAHNNIVRPIWTRLENSVLSVWTAVMDPYFTNARNVEFVPYAIEQAYPNPFSETTVLSFKIKEPVLLSLEVYDLFGHKIATLIEESVLQPGKYIKHFDAGKYNLSSGIYYFSLKGNGLNLQRKIIYQKKVIK